MNKKIISITVFILIAVAAFAKASTKKRVYDLEKAVVALSKSERNAWDVIDKMNQQVTSLEKKLSHKTTKRNKPKKMARIMQAREYELDEEEYDEEDDDDFYNPAD